MTQPQAIRAQAISRGDKIAFLAGLALFLLGQILLNLGSDFVSLQRPVDYAHWLLLLGSLMFVPFVARLPRSPFSLISLIAISLGVAAIIGMCVLDFIFWYLPDDAFEAELAARLIASPAIWPPFITIGPNYVFGLGLVLPSLAFWKVSRTGTVLVMAGMAVVALFYHWYNVVGYSIMLIGYAMNFGFLARAPNETAAR